MSILLNTHAHLIMVSISVMFQWGGIWFVCQWSSMSIGKWGFKIISVVFGTVDSWSSYFDNSWSWGGIYNRSSYFSNDSGWVDSWGGFWDNCVESMVVIGCVIYGTDWTVRFNEGVLSLNNITITDFMLGFYVSGVGVMNTIVEGIFWMTLKLRKKI